MNSHHESQIQYCTCPLETSLCGHTCLSMDVPVHSDGQETEDGANERHTQQGVDHIIQLGLGGTRPLQLPHISKHNHQVLPGLGEAGDGVEGR